MSEAEDLIEKSQGLNFVPPHKCKDHLKIIEETHSVNSFHNIVIGRKQKCKICSKVFEQFDPRGVYNGRL